MNQSFCYGCSWGCWFAWIIVNKYEIAAGVGPLKIMSPVRKFEIIWYFDKQIILNFHVYKIWLSFNLYGHIVSLPLWEQVEEYQLLPNN